MLKRFAITLCFLFLIPFHTYAAGCSASSAVVIDADTGIILYENNAYEQRSMASTTKIMTALLAVESGKLDEVVEITEQMLQTEGSSLGLKVGDELTLRDLITGMMLTSGNDSANAVACFISGSIEEFAKLMNSRAGELGMKSTLFVTPSGLDEGNHHSTAYDMAKLTAAAIKLDEFCEITAKQKATIKIGEESVTVYNHNKLLARDKQIFGVKTGYTKKAGRCLVSAKNFNGNQIICVTLNAPDDWNDHLNLYKACESKYTEYDVCGNIAIPVVGANSQEMNCLYEKKYYVLAGIKLEIYHKPFLYAPLKKGEKVGEVWVYCNDKLLERLPITAEEDVEYYAEQERSTTSEIHG